MNVRSLPSPLPDPQIVEPIRPPLPAPVVGVRGCIPGARLHLLVDGTIRSSIDTLSEDALIPAGLPALQERQAVWIVQTLCSESSPIEGRPTLVTRGRMTASATPATVERGSTVNVTVSATDVDTGAPIDGAQVLLDGKLVGQTGVAFQFKRVMARRTQLVWSRNRSPTSTKGSRSRSRTPRHAQGAPFPQHCSNAANPEHPQARFSDVDGRNSMGTGPDLHHLGCDTSVTLPDTRASAPDKRVSVRLATTWEVAGTINGIGFPYQTFPGTSTPTRHSSHGLTRTSRRAGWFCGTSSRTRTATRS